jgi:tetratricopeptide (TPR) repeat protein
LKKSIFVLGLFVVLLLSAVALGVGLFTNNPDFDKDPAFYKSLGNELVRQGKPGAEVAYERSLALKEDLNLRNNLAVIYYRNGKYDDAIKNLEVLIADDPQDPSHHYDLAVNLVDKFRNTENRSLDDLYTALSEYQNAEQLSPGFANAENNIAALKNVLKIK